MNTQNLKPFNTMTAEQHRELSRRGGQASGAARRAKRDRIEAAKAEQIADNELWRASFQMLHEAARMVKQSRPRTRRYY